LVLTEKEATEQLNLILDNLGIKSGDHIMLGIDMSKVPLPLYLAVLSREAFREREKKWCQFVLNTLTDRITDKGTLLVPAYSYCCTKPGSIFIRNTTPSEVGPFTEYFRSQSNTFRSLHPIFSISGIGLHAKAILDNVSSSAFGTQSAFDRFKNFDIKFLCLGVDIKNSITYSHHLEQHSGCVHRFNKAFNIEVRDGDKVGVKEWSAFLGYRGNNYTSDFSKLQQRLQQTNKLKEYIYNGGYNHLATVSDVDKIANELLFNDPYAFIDKKIRLEFNDANNLKEGTSTVIVSTVEL